jgi:hypothetical protein
MRFAMAVTKVSERIHRPDLVEALANHVNAEFLTTTGIDAVPAIPESSQSPGMPDSDEINTCYMICDRLCGMS